MDRHHDPHALIPLQDILATNHIAPLTYFKLYLEDRAPPVVLLGNELFVTESDHHLWKHHLRLASFDRKAKALGRRAP